MYRLVAIKIVQWKKDIQNNNDYFSNKYKIQ